MGVYSTRDINRGAAIRLLIDAVELASNDKLADMLFAMFGDETLNNYRVDGKYPYDSPGVDAIERAIEEMVKNEKGGGL